MKFKTIGLYTGDISKWGYHKLHTADGKHIFRDDKLVEVFEVETERLEREIHAVYENGMVVVFRKQDKQLLLVKPISPERLRRYNYEFSKELVDKVVQFKQDNT